MRMNLIEKMNEDMALSLCEKKEKIISDCLKRFTGKDIPLSELKGRLGVYMFETTKEEIFNIDGKPFVSFEPVKFNFSSDTKGHKITSSINYRYLGN